MTVPGRQVAKRAGTHRWLHAVGDHRRHWRMLVGKPIRRIEPIVDLRLRVAFRAPGHLLQEHVVVRLAPGRHRIRPVEIVGHRQSGEQRERNYR